MTPKTYQQLERENNQLRQQLADKEATIAHTTNLLERWLQEQKSGAVYTMNVVEKRLDYVPRKLHRA